jgi:drug/metabolite transporter (DMT)-like permease
MQNVGQTHVPPAQASLILCLESVFGVLFSVVFYGETLTPRVLLGFAVIFIAIVSSEVLATKEFKWPKRKTTSS